MSDIINVGDTVGFQYNGADLEGIVERVVKYPTPFAEASQDPNTWIYHVKCSDSSPRFGGTYVLGAKDLTVLSFVGKTL